jgi:hypothetical protein
MNYPLSKYPKNGTHWEKNVFIERQMKELREMEIERKERPLITHLPTVSIKEILGEEGS